MRLQIRSIDLVGAGRSVDFAPGLNIITGPIATGKTTLIRLLRFLVGGSLGNLPPEAKATVTHVAGKIVLGIDPYSVVRPAVATSSARVEIAGESDSLRLVATGGADLSYTEWLLEKLDLPRLRVPSAPTRPESEPTPVSINDYLLYCHLSQQDLGFSVFGHRDAFKNIKRKYVFDIVYGFYDVEAARLQEELRTVLAQLRSLQAQTDLFANLFQDTALSNRAALDYELSATRGELAAIESDWARLSHELPTNSPTAELQGRVLELEARHEQVKAALAAEQTGMRNLEAMVAQLESQSAKLTRAIVSGKHLVDFDFVVCPRCGSSVDHGRSIAPDTCYLCLQVPTVDFSKASLVKEQEAVDAQLVEAQDLLKGRRQRLDRLRVSVSEIDKQLQRERAELDFATKTYVSERANGIASLASRRSALKTREQQIAEYIEILSRLNDSHKRIGQLTVERTRIEQALEDAARDAPSAPARIATLKSVFNEVLERFQPPRFGEERDSTIDSATYLPIYHGRRFDDLSSPGLATLVNVAHALAHQITSIRLNLRLPNLLIIDGLSEHLGQEGLDPERLNAVYDTLIELSHELGDALQIIVVDNEVPSHARGFIRLELSEEDRLIPNEAFRPAR